MGLWCVKRFFAESVCCMGSRGCCLRAESARAPKGAVEAVVRWPSERGDASMFEDSGMELKSFKASVVRR